MIPVLLLTKIEDAFFFPVLPLLLAELLGGRGAKELQKYFLSVYGFSQVPIPLYILVLLVFFNFVCGIL